MKKSLWTMAAALALVGCSQDQLMPDNPVVQNKGAVGANIFVPATSRGTALNSVDDLIASNNGFDLFAFSILTDGSNEQFMSEVEFKYDGNAWDYANRGEMKFWQNVNPDTESMKFFALSPTYEKWYKENESYCGLNPGAQQITYTVPENVAEQVDLMYAQTDLDDPDEWSSTSDAYLNGVPLNFHHALSQIVFQARIADKDDGFVTAKIKSITVQNVHGEGTFYMDEASAILGENQYLDGDLTDDYNHDLWNTSDEADKAYTIEDLMTNEITETSAEPLTDGEVGGYETAMLLMPQQLTALDLSEIGGNVNSVNQEQFNMVSEKTGTYLKVSCRVEFERASGTIAIVGDKDATDEEAEGYYADLYIPISTTWNPGFKYIYTLIFSADSGDPVKATVESVDEWNSHREDAPNSGENAPGSSEENPIKIKSVDALYSLAAEVNAGDNKEGVYYEVSHGDFEGNRVVLEDWVPIGNENNSFNGFFAGGNNVFQITSFGETGNEYAELLGLFGYIGSGGKVKHISVELPDVEFTSDLDELYIGAIAAKNEGTVSSCRVEHINYRVNHDEAYVGGLVGYVNWGKISYCQTFGTITTEGALNRVGGIVGESGFSTVEDCWHCGNITNNSEGNGGYNEPATGGIVGFNGYGAIIVNCASYGRDEYGDNHKTVGQVNVGGITGDGSNSKIYVCYNANTVEGGQKNVGGIAGHTYVTEIHACYNVGTISADNATSGIGQIAGWDQPSTKFDSEEIIGTSSFFANYYLTDATNSIKGLGNKDDKGSSDVTNEFDPTVGTEEVTETQWMNWITTGESMNAYIQSIQSSVYENEGIWLPTYLLEDDKVSDDNTCPLLTYGVLL